MIVFVLSCQSPKQEQENNNTFGFATPIKINQSVLGYIHDLNDQDIFKLDLSDQKKGQLSRINLRFVKGLDIQLQIYKRNQLLKIIDDFRKNENEHISNFVLEPDIYYLIVKPGQYNYLFLSDEKQYLEHNPFNKNPYLLRIAPVFNRSIQETEPNDTIQEAYPLIIEKSIQGFFSPFYNKINSITNKKDIISTKPSHKKRESLQDFEGCDLDWFYFENTYLPDKTMVSLRITPNSPHVDIVAGIYDENHQLIHWLNHNPIGVAEHLHNLKIEFKRRYYLVVLGIPDEHSISSQKQYSYQIAINYLDTHNTHFESEVNNEFAQATQLIQKQIDGFITPRNDKDIYEIIIPKVQDNLIKQLLSVELTGILDMDLELHLYDSEQKLLRIYDNEPISKGEVIHNVDVSNLDKVYLLVKNSKDNHDENIHQSYQLSFSIHDMDQTEEVEFNDQIHHQTTEKNRQQNSQYWLQPNTPIQGHIHPRSYQFKSINQLPDQDVYFLQLNKNQPYQVHLTGIDKMTLKLQLFHIFNPVHPQKEIIVSGKRKKTLNFVNKTPRHAYSDWYFIIVKSTRRHQSSKDKRYQISLEAIAVTR